jgi:hypothetical protein
MSGFIFVRRMGIVRCQTAEERRFVSKKNAFTSLQIVCWMLSSQVIPSIPFWSSDPKYELRLRPHRELPHQCRVFCCESEVPFRGKAIQYEVKNLIDLMNESVVVGLRIYVHTLYNLRSLCWRWLVADGVVALYIRRPHGSFQPLQTVDRGGDRLLKTRREWDNEMLQCLC